jgi:hypothetical protein
MDNPKGRSRSGRRFADAGSDYIVFTYTFHLWGNKSERSAEPPPGFSKKIVLRILARRQKLAGDEKLDDRACLCRCVRFRGFSVDARAERFAAPACLRPLGRKPDRAHMRSDVCDLRQLQLLRPRALVERTSSGCAVFEDPGAASVLGAIAFSWRAHFRARAA